MLGRRLTVGADQARVALQPQPAELRPVLVPGVHENGDARPLPQCHGHARGRADQRRTLASHRVACRCTPSANTIRDGHKARRAVRRESWPGPRARASFSSSSSRSDSGVTPRDYSSAISTLLIVTGSRGRSCAPVWAVAILSSTSSPLGQLAEDRVVGRQAVVGVHDEELAAVGVRARRWPWPGCRGCTCALTGSSLKR